MLQLVSGTVELYNAIRTELLPTPSKSHYTFNLRDMSKVVQGLMRADPKITSSPEQVRCRCCGSPLAKKNTAPVCLPTAADSRITVLAAGIDQPVH
jgi:hypothetical protein